jgi:hypothetical protein
VPDIKKDFHVEQFHRQTKPAKVTAAVLKELLASLGTASRQPFILFRGVTKDFTDGALGEEPAMLTVGLAHDRADFQAAWSAHHQPVATLTGQQVGGAKPPEIANAAITQQVFRELHKHSLTKQAERVNASEHSPEG